MSLHDLDDYSNESMLALAALCRKCDVSIPDNPTHDELLSLIAQKVKELGWPTRWPIDTEFDGVKHATRTMYEKGCRCIPCRNVNAKYQREQRESFGLLPTLFRRAGRRAGKEKE